MAIEDGTNLDRLATENIFDNETKISDARPNLRNALLKRDQPAVEKSAIIDRGSVAMGNCTDTYNRIGSCANADSLSQLPFTFSSIINIIGINL